MTAKDWLGNHIIDRTTGNRLGQVIRLMAAPDHKTAVCLVIRPCDPRMPLLTLPWEKAISGQPALACVDDCQPLTSDSPFWEHWAYQLPLGLPGFNVEGSSPGLCCDAALDDHGRITVLSFSGGMEIPAADIACVGKDAIILDNNPESFPAEQRSAPSPIDSPLLGKIVTRDIAAPDGSLLARKGQRVDADLLTTMTNAGRMVALTLHTQNEE